MFTKYRNAALESLKFGVKLLMSSVIKLSPEHQTKCDPRGGHYRSKGVPTTGSGKKGREKNIHHS